MNGKWWFWFTKPQVPTGGTPLRTNQAEQLLLDQLQTGQRPEAEVRWNLARLYSFTHRQEQALEQVWRLVQNAETLEEKAHSYLAMGQLMEQVHDYEMAIRYYSEALALEPVDSQTWYFINNNLGYCLNHFGRHAEAEPYCRRAIEIDPLRHNAYKNLGIALEGQAGYAGAAVCYIKAVRINASDPRALRHLEALVKQHPEVAVDVPDFHAHLQACQLAVTHAAHACREILETVAQK